MSSVVHEILTAAEASFEGGAFHGSGGVNIQLRVARGELVMIRVERLAQATSVADAFSGMQTPVRGTVRFMRHDWSELAPHAADRLRSRIGRFFCAGAWLPRRSLLDNIVLPHLHHGDTPVQTLHDEAAALARRFALPGAPLRNPGDANRNELVRAGCVRAFLGRPALVLLEAPTDRADTRLVAQLVDVIRSARDAGAAVVWITRSEDVWHDDALPIDQRLRLTSHALVEIDQPRGAARSTGHYS